MRDKAVVNSISDKDITVIPLITNACLSCAEGCAKRGKPFSVRNSKNLDIKPGSVVKIGSSPKVEAIQGLLSVLFPVICAIGGYFASYPIAALFGNRPTEGLHAGFVLLFLAVAGLAVYALTRNQQRIIKPDILEIY